MAVERSGNTRFQRKAFLGREDGVVVISVLWICALVMWFALQIGAETRLQGEEQVNLLRRSQAMHLAIGGCYEAIARMGTPIPLGFDAPDETAWLPNGEPHIVQYQTGQAIVVIEAENRKVNINQANHLQLKAVFERAGVEEDAADRLADVTLDFIDKDDTPRLQGAEKDWYKQNGRRYPPFNGPLSSLDQMLLIPGISRQLFYGTGAGSVDGAQEEGDASIAIPGLPSKDSLFQMLSIYGNNVTLPDRETEQNDSLENILWESDGVYRILSCGIAASGSPPVIMWLTVRNAPEQANGYEVLYRKVL